MAAFVIRHAAPPDAADIGSLILLSAQEFMPAVFGGRIGPALRRLAGRRGTLFSYTHARVAVQGTSTAGAIVGYAGPEKAAEDPATGLALLLAVGPALFRRLGRLLALQRTIGQVAPDEWYVSNVAVFPEYRGRGIGRALMAAGEAEAARAGCARIVLDVETDHAPAIGLYRSLGYVPRPEGPPLLLAGRSFTFLRLEKTLSKNGR